jgi:hypothetical protein
MPTYLFHYREDGRVYPDTGGADLPNVEAAEVEAVATALQVAKDVLSRDKPLIRIEVCDKDDRPLFIASVTLTLDDAQVPSSESSKKADVMS